MATAQSSYSLTAIVLHWAIAALIIGQIVMGLTMALLDDQALAFDLIQWHKSFGLLTLALVVLRLLWRLLHRPPALPAAMPKRERQAAYLSHVLLYILMFAVPLTGWLLASTSVLNIPTYAFNLVVIPHLPVRASDAAEAFWTAAHHWLAFALAGLVALHGAAALRHHFILGDDVLTRMLRADNPSPKS